MIKHVRGETGKRHLGLMAKLLLRRVERLPRETRRQKIILDWLDNGVPVKARF